jgi:hypothetical protein
MDLSYLIRSEWQGGGWRMAGAADGMEGNNGGGACAGFEMEISKGFDMAHSSWFWDSRSARLHLDERLTGQVDVPEVASVEQTSLPFRQATGKTP